MSQRDVRPEDELVLFFQSLPAKKRREYDQLAELDRRFGEDAAAERNASKGGGEAGKEGA
ncbi:MAG TPA: hypothetical protein VM580_12705 [Labilithrix sp.]|nr:hypothetical protein [Labilithrix sp.]